VTELLEKLIDVQIAGIREAIDAGFEAAKERHSRQEHELDTLRERINALPAGQVSELATKLATYEARHTQAHDRLEELRRLVLGPDLESGLPARLDALEARAPALAPLTEHTPPLGERVASMELEVAENSKTTAELRRWKRRVLIALGSGGGIGFLGGGGMEKLAVSLRAVVEALTGGGG